MQMVLMPYDLFSWKKEKTAIRIRMSAITSIKIQLDQMAAHSFRDDPPPSCPIWLFLLVLLHVVPAFAGHWLLIFSPFRRPGPALTLLLSYWPHFPQIPGNRPFPCRAQYIIGYFKCRVGRWIVDCFLWVRRHRRWGAVTGKISKIC